MQREPKVIILIVNWNGYRDTIECIESIQKVNYHNYQIIIIDNGSINESVREIKKKFPEITLIENKENLGFAEGNNVGIRYALKLGADYVLLLNSDTIVDPEFLKKLVEVGENDRNVGIIQSKILKQSNPLIIDSVGHFFSPIRGPTDMYSGRLDKKKFVKIQEISGACAAAALFKTDVFLKAGLFEEGFFCIFEDVDLSWRIRLMGYKILLAPESIVYHKRGISGQSIPESKYYASRNYLYLIIKYYSLNCILKFLPFHLFKFAKVFYYSFKTDHSFIALIKSLIENLKKRNSTQSNPLIKKLQKEMNGKYF